MEMMAQVESCLQQSLEETQLSYLPQRPPINISFHDLSYSVNDGQVQKLILRGINGEFRSGQLTAILGASGAGKTTLLNLLAGFRNKNTNGQICTNGEPRNLNQFRKQSRYIMQEDLVQPWLTLWESMIIAADLKLGSTLDKRKKEIVVEEIIQILRLSKAKNTHTEKLSGGERKRLSIALELINNPPVLFLDEPTSGLDIVASSTCVSLLKQVARCGRTVICSLHTPSAKTFAEFDHVYLLADGRCAYQGTPAGVIPFLHKLQLPCPKTYNPADFRRKTSSLTADKFFSQQNVIPVIEVSSGEYGPYSDDMVKAVENGKNESWRNYGNDEEVTSLNENNVQIYTSETHCNKHGSSGYQQFITLSRRMWLQNIRNKEYLWIRISLHTFISTIIATMFYKIGIDGSRTIYNFGFCYACIIAMLYIPMMPILLSFPSEIKLLKREYFNRWYGLKPFYTALVISRSPLTIFFSLLYVFIVYPLTGQPMELARISMFASTCVLLSLISESLGTVIGSSLNIVNSVFTGPALSVPLMLLAVYGIGEGDQPPLLIWKLARACSFLRYGLEGLVAAVYGPPRAKVACPDHIDYCELSDVAYLVKLLGMSGLSFWKDFWVLSAMLLTMTLGGYYLLRQRLSPNYAFRLLRYIGNIAKNKMR